MSKLNLFLAACAFGILTVAATAQTEFTIYSFPTTGAATSFTEGRLVADSAGNLYGASESGGKNRFGFVYELVKPVAPATKWTEVVLYSFKCRCWNGDGERPYAGVVFDAAGNLYGTTYQGGAYNEGAVFELSPSATGWSEKLLYSFQGGTDGVGSRSNTGLAFDPSGNLWGFTNKGGDGTGSPCLGGCGTIYELTPTSGGGWQESVIYRFGKLGLGGFPVGTPVFDATGALYGAASGGGDNRGVIYKLTPPATPGDPWTYKILHVFVGTDGAGPTGLVLRAGNLYGVTEAGGANSGSGSGDGTVFELAHPTPGSPVWTLNTLYSFGASTTDGTFPADRVAFDQQGNMWGVTARGGDSGAGTVFELVPGTNWTETIVHSFTGNSVEGGFPAVGLVQAPNGVFYGTTQQTAAFGVRP